MKRKIYFIIFLFPVLTSLSAQDLIYFANGNTKEVLLVESDASTIMFKDANAETSQLTLVSTVLVDSIKYQSGIVESYVEYDEFKLPFRNLEAHYQVGLDLISFLSRNFRATYEYIPSNGLVGFYVPLTINFGTSNSYWYDENSVGIGIKLYMPLLIKKIQYATGALLYGGNYLEQYWNNNDYEEKRFGFANFSWTNHLSYSFSQNFLVSSSIDFKIFSPYIADAIDDYGYSYSPRQDTFLPYIHLNLIVRL